MIGVSFRLLVHKQQASVHTVAGTRIPDFTRRVVAQLRLLVSKHGVYLSRGHDGVNQSTSNNTNGDCLPCGQSTTAVTTNEGYISCGQVKMKTTFPVVK